MLRLAALGLLLSAVLAAPAQAQDRYSLANGCYALKAPNGKLVAKTADGAYRATSDRGEPFRMQATDLGRYLLYGKDRDFLAYGTQQVVDLPSIPPLPKAKAAQLGKRVQSETAPSDSADWRVDGAAGAFTITLPSESRALGVDGAGNLVLTGVRRALRVRARRRAAPSTPSRRPT